MKTLTLTLGFLVIGAPELASQQNDEHLERARRILAQTPLIDGHNDLPWAIREFQTAPRSVARYDITRRAPGHTDLERLGRGMLGAQFWSVYTPAGYADSGFARMQLEQIDIAASLLVSTAATSRWRGMHRTSSAFLPAARLHPCLASKGDTPSRIHWVF